MILPFFSMACYEPSTGKPVFPFQASTAPRSSAPRQTASIRSSRGSCFNVSTSWRPMGALPLVGPPMGGLPSGKLT